MDDPKWYKQAIMQPTPKSVMLYNKCNMVPKFLYKITASPIKAEHDSYFVFLYYSLSSGFLTDLKLPSNNFLIALTDQTNITSLIILTFFPNCKHITFN